MNGCRGRVRRHGRAFAAGAPWFPSYPALARSRSGVEPDQPDLWRVLSHAAGLSVVVGMLADRFIPLNRLFAILNAMTCLALLTLGEWRSFPAVVGYTLYFACFNPTLYLMNALSFHHLPNPREQFGRLRAWGSAGWIIPFLPISLWLGFRGGKDLNFVLYVGVVCSLAMVALSFWLPHTPPGARRVAGSQERGGAYGPAAWRLLRDPDYLVLLVSTFLIAGSFSLMTYYSPPLLGIAACPRVWIGPIQAIAVVSEIVLFQGQPALLRSRFDYAKIVIAGVWR